MSKKKMIMITIASITLTVIMVTIVFAFYRGMKHHEKDHISSQATFQEKLISGFIGVELGFSSTILDYDNHVKDQLLKNENYKTETNTCFAKLLLNPINKAIIINRDTIHELPHTFLDHGFWINLEKRIVASEKTTSSEIFINDYIRFVAPTNNLFTNFDTLELLVDFKILTDELSHLTTCCYNYYDKATIKKIQIDKKIDSVDSYYNFQDEPMCSLNYLQILSFIPMDNLPDNFFYCHYKANEEPFTTLFIPVRNGDFDVEGLVVISFPDSIYPGFFTDFLVQSILAFIIFLLTLSSYYFFRRSKKAQLKFNSNKSDSATKPEINFPNQKKETGINHKTLGLLTHELRTPINAIQGFTDLLAEKITQPENLQYIQAIKKSTRNLLVYINNIIDVSKIETGELKINPEQVNIRLLLNEVKGILTNRSQNNEVALGFCISQDLPEIIMIDEARIKQILISLVNHAILTTQKGDLKVTYSAINISETKHKFELQITIEQRETLESTGDNPDKSGYFSKRDFSNKNQVHISTDIYFTEKLLPFLNGRVSYQNDENNGLIVTCNFTEVEYISEEFIKSKTKVPKLSNIKFEPCKILVVDDVAQNRFLIKELVKKTSITFFEAQNGKLALEKAFEHKPDLIFMDIRMPMMDGVEATKILRQDDYLKFAKIIALTASVGDNEINEIRKTGFDDILTKPIKLKKLIQILLTYLPHSITEENADEITANKGEEILEQPSEIEQNILLFALENELFKTWQNAKSSGFVSEISNFGNLIFETGKKHASKDLMEYGVSVLDAAERFDVTEMKNILNTYGNLIEKVKSLNLP